MNQNTISGNGKAVSEYNSDAMDTIISNETDEERTCLLGGGAGRSSDRSGFRGIEGAKGVILPLDHRVRQMDLTVMAYN